MTTKADVLAILNEDLSNLTVNGQAQDAVIAKKYQAMVDAAAATHDGAVADAGKAYDDAVAQLAATRDNAIQAAASALDQAKTDIANQQTIEQQAATKARQDQADKIAKALNFVNTLLPDTSSIAD